MNVGVVVTAYDEEAFLGDMLKSIAAQTRRADAVVVVDDGSNDSSLDVALELTDGWPEARVISVTNRGHASARNAGVMAMPHVDAVACVDGDDWLEPNYLEELRLALALADADAAVPAMERHGKRAHGPRLPHVQHPDVEQLWEECLIWSYALIRRDVLEQIGGWHGLMGADADWDFWVDFVTRGYRLTYTDRTHFHYRVHGASLTRTMTSDDRRVNVAEMLRHHRR